MMGLQVTPADTSNIFALMQALADPEKTRAALAEMAERSEELRKATEASVAAGKEATLAKLMADSAKREAEDALASLKLAQEQWERDKGAATDRARADAERLDQAKVALAIREDAIGKREAAFAEERKAAMDKLSEREAAVVVQEQALASEAERLKADRKRLDDDKAAFEVKVRKISEAVKFA